MHTLRGVGAAVVVAGMAGAVMSNAGCARSAPNDGDGTSSTESSSQALTSVGVLAPGRSDIEGRNIYAPPDEGEIAFPMTLDVSLPGELSIETPAMVNGEFDVRIKYSKKHNYVKVHLHGKGLPYRQTFHKDFDDSTEFNQEFVTLENAHWQFWLMGTLFGRYHETAYFDSTTLKFIGTRFDFAPLGSRPQPAPGTFITAPVNAIRMICSPIFEGKPDGDLDFDYELKYDHMEDAMGSPGTVNMVLPFDLCEPDHLTNYWTNTRLTDDMFMTWDYYLQSIWNGEGIGTVFTAEPAEKPGFLGFRDNNMVGPGQIWPEIIPHGMGMDFMTAANGFGGGSIIPIHGHTYQLAPWPTSAPGQRHLCGVH